MIRLIHMFHHSEGVLQNALVLQDTCSDRWEWLVASTPHTLFVAEYAEDIFLKSVLPIVIVQADLDTGRKTVVAMRHPGEWVWT